MNEQKNEKKIYTPPTVTDHGKVVEKTKGLEGDCWEIYGHQGKTTGN